MKRSSPGAVATTLLASAALAAAGACATRTRSAADAARPAPAATPATAAAPAAAARRDYTEGDARFMQRMIGHHAQALAMTALVPARSRRDDLRLMAERIELTQRDEIALMRRWLEERGEAVPPADAPHGRHAAGHAAAGHDAMRHGAAPMPGMLTADELSRLAAASGPEFDRLFLQYMTRHHEGALAMVADFFATPGVGQEPEIFRLASDVDADQRAEIARMAALLRTLQSR